MGLRHVSGGPQAALRARSSARWAAWARAARARAMPMRPTWRRWLVGAVARERGRSAAGSNWGCSKVRSGSMYFIMPRGWDRYPCPLPLPVTPARSIPARSIPARSIPARFTPARSIPARSIPARFTPVRFTPARFTPARFTPARFTPARFTPARFTPARYPARCPWLGKRRPGAGDGARGAPAGYRPNGIVTATLTAKKLAPPRQNGPGPFAALSNGPIKSIVIMDNMGLVWRL